MLAIAGIGAAVAHRDAESGVDEAVRLVADDAGWSGAEVSANTMLAISTALRRDAESCAKETSAADARCRPLFAGSAHSHAGAIGLLRCTRVDLFDAREAMRTYVAALRDDITSARLPALPYCT